jgi:type III restriction enzyme
MPDIQNLYQTIGEKAYRMRLPFPEIPKYIIDNLKYSFFDWQKEGMENFITFQNIKTTESPNLPTHLMFNMATGTGKTMMMAATILYYYNQGYRHFIFFVNQNNIVDKTENNFIDSSHNKYLFKDKIVIDDKTIDIRKVDLFSDNPDGIEIKFCTVQALHNEIHKVEENKTTIQDLWDKDIVMLADEAHHLNGQTKVKKGEQESIDFVDKLDAKNFERIGWEHTIIELILKRNNQSGTNKNVLLEFTATIPETQEIAKKYEDKIIAKFGLKEFLSAGYTKEINLVSSTLGKKERILQALLFNWYRHKIAIKHGIANFKSVVLFRSKTIVESAQDYEEFLDLTSNIESSDFDFLKTIGDQIFQSQKNSLNENGKSRTEQVIRFIKDNNINYAEVAEFVRFSFGLKNTIITNSKTNKTQKEKTDADQEKLLNNLEDKNNNIRAIFTVDRLTEGWDVLNLFDIVRLYQGQNAGGSDKKTPESTTKEKQLIGRGVRYFPFEYKDKTKNKRKFDDDLNHELRILEELFYYTYDEESRYISHLKDELRKDGYIRDDRTMKTFALKPEFVASNFYKNTKVWYNEKMPNPNRQKKTLEEIKKDFILKYKIQGLELNEQEIDFDKAEDIIKLNLQEKGFCILPIKFQDIEKHIFRKAINIKSKQGGSLVQFQKLKKELKIESLEDLQNTEFLGDFDINVVANKKTKIEDIATQDMLRITNKFLDRVFDELYNSIATHVGGNFIAGSFAEKFGEPKIKSIQSNNLDDTIARDNEWYIIDGFVGTSEEKELISFIKESIGNLEEKYKEIYLLRNEEIYKIYDFEKGRGFQPDFLLFLKDKDKLQYQIFIEPKGNQFLDGNNTFEDGKEGWKESFLKKISTKYGLENIIRAENPNYRLIGLPFFNIKNNSEFEKEYSKLIS